MTSQELSADAQGARSADALRDADSLLLDGLAVGAVRQHSSIGSEGVEASDGKVLLVALGCDDLLLGL